MHQNKIGLESGSSTKAAPAAGVISTVVGVTANRPTLDVIGNHLLTKGGVEPVQWQRYHQPVEGGKWHSVPEADTAALFDRNPPALVATCATNFVEHEDDTCTERNHAYYLADWVWFDIDCDAPDEAIKAVHRFVRKLEATGLDLRCLRLYASGKKGYHVFLPLSAFVDDWWENLTAAEMRWFPNICKEVAQSLYVEGLDMGVYSARKGRQFRQPNVQREISTYKVPLTLNEFWNITPELYAEYVSNPRPEVATVPTEVNNTLGGYWDAAAAKVEVSEEAKANAIAAPVTDEKIQRVKSVLEYLHPDDESEDHEKHHLRLQVIQAVHFELGREAGLSVVREWAKQSASKDFTGAEWRQMFHSSSAKGGKVTALGTLITRAQARGYEVDRNQNPAHDPAVNEDATPAYQTEKGITEFLAQKYAGQIRYVEDIGSWLYWTGKEWAFDADGSCVNQLIGKEGRRLYAMALQAQVADIKALPDDADEKARKAIEGQYDGVIKFYRALDGATRIRNIKGLLPHESALRIGSRLLDSHAYLLNVDNGVLNLSTGEMQPHTPNLLLTQRAYVAYDRSARCDRWLQFVDEISCGDRRLADYLQCVIGYALSGDISRHEAFFLHGDGSNGKSVLVNTLRTLLGSYCKSLSVDAIMVQRGGGGPTPDLLAVRGARMVVTSEMSAGRQLNEGVFKDLVSGDTITVRNLYSKHVIEMQFCCKVFMPTNTLPTIAGQDYGVWRRIRAIPFSRTFEGAEKDPQLEAKLKAELPGILAWAVEGYQRYKAQGFSVPACVEGKTAEYREDLDIVKHFVADALVQDEQGRQDGGEIPAAVLAQVYEHYCKVLNHPSMGGVRFGREVKKYLTDGRRFTSGWRYLGWRVNPDWLPAKLWDDISTKQLLTIVDPSED